MSTSNGTMAVSLGGSLRLIALDIFHLNSSGMKRIAEISSIGSSPLMLILFESIDIIETTLHQNSSAKR